MISTMTNDSSRVITLTRAIAELIALVDEQDKQINSLKAKVSYLLKKNTELELDNTVLSDSLVALDEAPNTNQSEGGLDV